MNVRRFITTIMVCATVLAGQQAWAHKVNLFAYAEDGQIFVEGYFVDGKKAQNSAVRVYSPADELLVEGQTDDEGIFRFPIPQRSDLKIVLDAGMGHQSDLVLAGDELGGVPKAKAAEQRNASPAEPPDATGNHMPQVGQLDQDRLQALVDHAVTEAIKPLVRELAASREKASLSGIVGGVGYIIGFLGLFAYFKARQQGAKRDDE